MEKKAEKRGIPRSKPLTNIFKANANVLQIWIILLGGSLQPFISHTAYFTLAPAAQQNLRIPLLILLVRLWPNPLSVSWYSGFGICAKA